ncbi:MAG: hypothetical protein KDG51_06775, partial [Calditrichaeota bacterium]|nr:hypothetical protein [Calditrichota bacterium]
AVLPTAPGYVQNSNKGKGFAHSFVWFALLTMFAGRAGAVCSLTLAMFVRFAHDISHFVRDVCLRRYLLAAARDID